MTEIEKDSGLPLSAMSFAALVTSYPNIISASKKTSVCINWREALVYLVNSAQTVCFEQTHSKSELLFSDRSYPTKS